MWENLPAGSRQSVCDTLATYSGHDALARFARLVKLAHENQLAAGTMAQTVANGKRKRDDSDVAQLPSMRPRLAEAAAPLKPVGVDFNSSTFPKSPVPFGQSIFSFAPVGASPSVGQPPPAMPSTAGRVNPTISPANPASATAKPAVVFGQPISVKQETPANPPSDCDEQFNIEDRKFPSAMPNNGPGTTPSNMPSAQHASFGGVPAASRAAPPQGNFGSAAVSTVYKPPFTGVDMSTLKVPANSNVNLTMNVFQAPSSLHQNVGSGAPKKLKCIQCKAFYIETQNTALECRRHTGMTSCFHFVCQRNGEL